MSSDLSRDYLAAYAEKEVRERLQRATPPAERYIVAAPSEPAESTRVVQKWVRLHAFLPTCVTCLAYALWFCSTITALSCTFTHACTLLCCPCHS